MDYLVLITEMTLLNKAQAINEHRFFYAGGMYEVVSRDCVRNLVYARYIEFDELDPLTLVYQ